jgi:4-amino-4-deoxy-L-arabinose transferase-like glycosyltransferase
VLDRAEPSTEPALPSGPSADRPTLDQPPAPLSRWIWAPVAAVLLALLLVAGRYGFHRDEFYFIESGHHPAWAEPDNPMLVPYLATGWHHLVGGRLWAFRILPALAAAGFVVVAALTAREFGGRGRHQVAAATATALTSIVLATGHLFSTTTFDMAVSATAVWLLVAAVRTDRWPAWLLLGITVGVAMEIKILAAFVIGCCLLGLLITGPRRPFSRPRLWTAAGIAALLAAPNLIWQARNGWPMLQIAGSIAGGGSTSSADRASVIPLHLLTVGPVVCVVLIVGVVWTIRRPRLRWLGVGYLLFLIFVLASGGKAYYPAAFLPALLAAGSMALLDRVLSRRARRVVAVVLLACSVIITPLLTLPIAPVGSALFRIAAAVNPDSAETVGWDGYLNTIRTVAAGVPPARRPRTVIITSNYGEAGMLSRYERMQARTRMPPGAALPPVYSGHNGYAAWGPPPADTATVIMVGDVDPGRLSAWFDRCRQAATLVSPAGVDNEENGAPVRICTGPRQPWNRLWPQMSHLS